MSTNKKHATDALKRTRDEKITITEGFKRSDLGNARKLLEEQLRGSREITIIVIQN